MPNVSRNAGQDRRLDEPNLRWLHVCTLPDVKTKSVHNRAGVNKIFRRQQLQNTHSKDTIWNSINKNYVAHLISQVMVSESACRCLPPYRELGLRDSRHLLTSWYHRSPENTKYARKPWLYICPTGLLPSADWLATVSNPEFKRVQIILTSYTSVTL